MLLAQRPPGSERRRLFPLGSEKSSQNALGGAISSEIRVEGQGKSRETGQGQEPGSRGHGGFASEALILPASCAPRRAMIGFCIKHYFTVK